MALIDLDKFVESLMWMWDSYKNNPLFKNPIFNDIKLALDKQGLVYKDGKIVKTQRRVSAEAKEDGYGESEDEKVRKSLIHLVHLYGGEFGMIDANISVEKAIVWLEKQTNTIPNECVFRPLAGTDIKSAAKQAIEQQGVLAKEIVLAFNGAYIPVKGKAQDIIVNEYNSWLKKQEQKPYSQMEKCIDCQFNYTGYCNGTCILKNNKQKPSDKIEPKFKVGDWIVSDCNNVAYIESISETKYNLQCKDGYHEKMSIEYIDRCWHLWTIQDAKDGDVLVDRFSKDNIIILYKGINPKLSVLAYCGWNGYNLSIKTNGLGYGNLDNTNYSLATKEQCYLLFQKIVESGYMWDTEKKELKKIPNASEECKIEHIEHGEYYYCIKDYYSGGCKRVSKGVVIQALRGMSMMALGAKANEYFIPVKCIVDNKHAWTEEDRTMAFTLMRDVDQMSYISKEGKNERIGWLNSLDGKFASTESTWSEEDESMLEKVINFIPHHMTAQSYNEFFNWFQSLKNRIKGE